MSGQGVSRRDVLRTLAAGAVGGSVLRVIPAKAAEYAHQMVHNEKAAAAAGKYAPKFFDAHQYQTLNSLCDTILPKDEKSGGAIEAGAPEFIDLLTSENEEFQVALGGGLLWLDSRCMDQYGKVYLECAAEQRKEILDLIAYKKNAKADPSLSQGAAFFAFLRDATCDGYYTSKIGIEDLQYVGNVARSEWLGCPYLPS
jgi:gluconate 2-dehydrogenase gamma chain